MTIYYVFDILRKVNITPEELFQLISHPLRLRTVMLLRHARELCVCDLTRALVAPQPLMSRHLAALREAGLLLVRREGLWMHYRISTALPSWATAVIEAAEKGVMNTQPYKGDRAALAHASRRGRPPRCA